MCLYCEYLLLFIQDVMMLVSTAVTVTLYVPQTVKSRVTYRVERVLTVNLDGMEHIATQVR